MVKPADCQRCHKLAECWKDPGPNRLTAADMQRESERVTTDRYRDDLERMMIWTEEACRAAREEARG